MKTEFMDRLGCISVLLGGRLVRSLPASAAFAIGSLLGDIAFLFSSRRHYAYADLKAAFGGRHTPMERWRIAREHYRQIGRSAVEMLRFPLLDDAGVKENIRIHHIERFEEVARRKEGAMLLTAHLGNWELIQIVSGILGYPIRALMQKQKHSRLNDLLNGLRRSRGSQITATGMGVRELLRALRKGELVGLLGDQSAGKDQGVIVPFFGRKTTIPTGAFELAAKTGAPILPAFIVRVKGEKHSIFVEEPVTCNLAHDQADALKEPVLKYVKMVENLVSTYPDQWLWAKKRWKYSWTKRLVILSDGKAGHYKQSQAVAAQFYTLKTQYGRPGMEYPTEPIEVRFRSPFHRKLFFVFAFFFIPWAQGRLHWLRFFFEPQTARAVESAKGDFIISAGSSLVPLNLCIARENRSKSIVLMKPPIPYHLYRYDLAIVPAHDEGLLPRGDIHRTWLTPSSVDVFATQGILEEWKSRLAGKQGPRISVFLGGSTQRYRMRLEDIEKTFQILAGQAAGGMDYLITTSRRTPQEICCFLKEKVKDLPECRALVIACEDTRAGIAEAMMQIADVLIVTEDSISMISEAVRAGKRVIVLAAGEFRLLPAKHRRFLELLQEEGAVSYVRAEGLQRILETVSAAPAENFTVRENNRLRESLERIL